jgi:hypothetical protein
MNHNKDFFNYDALNYLDNDIDNILQNIETEEIIIVPFKINVTSNQPFNTFLLVNDFTGSLIFPYINIKHFENSPNSILHLLIFKLYSVLLSNNSSECFKYNLDDFINLMDFKGIYTYENKLYAFIDLSKIEINATLINKNSFYWFALIDEILNKKKLCDIKINKEVTDFFINNNEFIYFKNSKEELIEIPIVVYTGTYEKDLDFKIIFGNTPCDNNAIVGSGYYFTDYKNAFRQGGWSKDYKPEFKYGKLITDDENGKYIKGGIIRYAVFLANNLVKLNYPNDIIDESEIKKNKLSYTNENMDKNYDDYIYEKMTIRISDHDGLWSKTFDSAYLGYTELDNGDYLKNTPIIVIKDYEQQMPLSYHYVNKKTLEGNINDYLIL